jgi:hypothetical protein
VESRLPPLTTSAVPEGSIRPHSTTQFLSRWTRGRNPLPCPQGARCAALDAPFPEPALRVSPFSDQSHASPPPQGLCHPDTPLEVISSPASAGPATQPTFSPPARRGEGMSRPVSLLTAIVV